MNHTIEGYRDFLAKRDGEADLLNRQLANRELFFNDLEANLVRSDHPADRKVFLRNLRRRRPEPGLDHKMLFLLATAKLNQAERFGVGLGETYGRNSDENLPPENVYLELEEHYHTRLLGIRARCIWSDLPGGSAAVRDATVRQDRRVPTRTARFPVRRSRRNGWLHHV